VRLARVVLVAGLVAAFAACGSDDDPADGTGGSGGGTAGTGGDGGGGTGGTGGTGATGGSGGGTGGSGGGGTVSDCDDVETFLAQQRDPFLLAGSVGAERYDDGKPIALEPGFDTEAEVKAWDWNVQTPAGDVTKIELWSDTAGGISVYWPEASFTVFDVGNMVRIRRTTDWIVLESSGWAFALTVRTGAGLAGGAEAILDDGPALTPSRQCSLPPAGGCTVTAVEQLASWKGDEGTAKAGGTFDFTTDARSAWSVRNWAALRSGDCADPRFAQVTAVWGFPWR